MWLTAGQSVSSIPSYLRSAWEISSGYSSFATSAPSPGDLTVSVLALVPIAVIGVVSLRRRALPLGMLMIPCGAWALVTYKEGIVDGAPHRLIEAVTMMALLIMVAIAGATRFPSLVSATACGGLAFVWLFLSPSVGLGAADWNTAPPGDGSPGAVTSAYQRYASLFFSAADRTQLILQEKQDVRREAGLSPATLAAMRAGNNLFVPIDVGRAWAYGVAWVAGPVLQSYGAYTPWLQEVDAATLQGPSRPDHVVMTIDWILDSWPQFEDAGALRALLANYHLSSVTLSQTDPGVLLFDRGAPALSPATCTRTLPSARLNAAIPVPAAPVSSYLTIDLRQSLAGRIRTTLVRGGGVEMSVDVDGQWTAPHHLDTASAPNGLFVGGLITDAPQLNDLLTGRGRAVIAAVRLTSPSPDDFVEPFAVSLQTSCQG